MSVSIVLDTNFLLIPGQFGVDIFSGIEKVMEEPYTLNIVKGTLDELDKVIGTANGRDKAAARLALGFLKTKSINIIDYAPDTCVDDALSGLSEKGMVIATQDIELKKRLKGRKIILRQKKYIALEE